MQEVYKKGHPKDSSTLPASLVLYTGTGLFLVSFIALFLELLLIRWVPSHIRIVAYYGNLMLLSSFLGLGCGALVERWSLKLHRWFAVSMLLLIVCVTGMKGIEFQQGPDEIRFLFSSAASTTYTFPIVLIFILNVLVFVPLGNLLGSYFQRMRPLWAYTCVIGGAITGTVVFGYHHNLVVLRDHLAREYGSDSRGTDYGSLRESRGNQDKTILAAFLFTSYCISCLSLFFPHRRGARLELQVYPTL